MGLLGSIMGAPAAVARAVTGGGDRDRRDRGAQSPAALDSGEGEFGADR